MKWSRTTSPRLHLILIFLGFWFCVKYFLKKHSNRCMHPILHGLRTPRESFFSKIQNFWAWADKLGWNFMRHLGYFWPNYKQYFGFVSPLSMGKCSWFYFLQKTFVFRSKTYNSQILPKLEIVRKEFGEQLSYFRLRCYSQKKSPWKNSKENLAERKFSCNKISEKQNLLEIIFLEKNQIKTFSSRKSFLKKIFSK